VFKAIDGWKTELALLGLIILRVALKLDWIDREVYDWALMPVVGFGGIALKHAIRKSGSVNDARARHGASVGGNGQQ